MGIEFHCGGYCIQRSRLGDGNVKAAYGVSRRRDFVFGQVVFDNLRHRTRGKTLCTRRAVFPEWLEHL